MQLPCHIIWNTNLWPWFKYLQRSMNNLNLFTNSSSPSKSLVHFANEVVLHGSEFLWYYRNDPEWLAQHQYKISKRCLAWSFAQSHCLQLLAKQILVQRNLHIACWLRRGLWTERKRATDVEVTDHDLAALQPCQHCTDNSWLMITVILKSRGRNQE